MVQCSTSYKLRVEEGECALPGTKRAAARISEDRAYGQFEAKWTEAD